MARDLKILPEMYENAEHVGPGFDLERDSKLFDIIDGVKTYERPPTTELRGLTINGDGYGLDTDSYGGEIRFCLAEDLAVAIENYTPPHWENKAFKAWLSHAPSNWKLYIFWD